jgi:hypothetical protein
MVYNPWSRGVEMAAPSVPRIMQLILYMERDWAPITIKDRPVRRSLRHAPADLCDAFHTRCHACPRYGRGGRLTNPAVIAAFPDLPRA